jgi:hypothetical protein
MLKDWITLLEKEGILNRIIIDSKTHYRINTTSKFVFPEIFIKYIQSEYDSEYEKGGYIFFKPSLNDNQVEFIVEEVIFLENISDTPQRSYLWDYNEKNRKLDEALQKKLLPISFHTHPTKSTDVIAESIHYLNQLNTSDGDQMCSLRGISLDDIVLRLPDILIVGNGTNASSVFIGFYNGLIAPIAFTKHKEHLKKKSSDTLTTFLEDRLDTPEKKSVAFLGALAAVILCIRYPKIGIPLVMVAATVTPQLVYQFQEQNEFFGISQGKYLEIVIPRITDEEILNNELEAESKHQKWIEEQRIRIAKENGLA